MATFKTWEQTIGFVFGTGIQAFEDGHFPTDFDVARRLIALVDEERKTYRYKPDVAISTLSQELVSFWEIHSNLPIKSVKSIGNIFFWYFVSFIDVVALLIHNCKFKIKCYFLSGINLRVSETQRTPIIAALSPCPL